MRTLLTEEPLDPGRLLQEFLDDCAGAGAVVSFCGLARDRGAEGGRVAMLQLERHPRLTALSLERIAADGADRFDLSNLLIVHRWGAIAPEDCIVFVAAASRHRRAAFEAADYLMDRLKTEAVLWKKEETVDGGRWIEPSDADRAAVARWER